MNQIDRAFAEGTPIDGALRAAGIQMLREHRAEGRPVVTWRDGQVAWLTMDEIDAELARLAEEDRQAA